MANKHFTDLVRRGNPTGEVIASDDFLVRIRGLNPTARSALVLFEDGSKGIVWEVAENSVTTLRLGGTAIPVGTGAVVQHDELVTKVGRGFLGRVVSVTGEPLDGKGPIAPDGTWPVFNTAPPITVRQSLDTQVTTGVTVADMLFPLIRGQRMAVLGESKSGKSAFLSQIALSQRGSGLIMVFGLVAKRRADIDDLLRRLYDGQVMDQCVVVVSTVFDSLVTSYLVPYVACAIAEYFWQTQRQDVVIAYDDLTAHAMVYREISLLAGVSPGRDSYPGDMFYAHSSLLERAGRLKSTGSTLTALATVTSPGGDITGYMPTNIMSITDGQYIFDLETFRQGIKPAINTGLSVSRVGGRSHSQRQKQLAGEVMKKLALYREAAAYSQFGSELALAAQADLETGKMILEVMKQGPLDHYGLLAQQLMLEIIISLPRGSTIDIDKMKQLANEYGAKVTGGSPFDSVQQELLQACAIELKGTAEPPAAPQPETTTAAKKTEVKP